VKTNQTATIFLGIIVSVIVVIVLRELRAVFIPLFFATLFSFLVGPWVRKLVQRRIPQWIVLTLLVAVIFVVIELLGTLIYTSAASFIREFPRYEARMTLLFQDTLKALSIQQEDAQGYLDRLDWGKALSQFSVTKIMSGTLGSFMNFIINMILVLIFMLFILAGWTRLHRRISRAFEPQRAQQIAQMIESVEGRVQTYLLAKTVISLGTALVGMGILTLFGVDFVIICGLFLFLFNFIPNIGSVIASLFPILVCFLEFGFSWKIPGLAVCMLGLQMTFGNVVEPMLMGKGLNLSPLVVLLSLIFWGWVWGIIGMVLAVPLTATLKIIFEEIDTLRPIAILMSQE
jgi:AI-2 transport protein TqsA